MIRFSSVTAAASAGGRSRMTRNLESPLHFLPPFPGRKLGAHRPMPRYRGEVEDHVPRRSSITIAPESRTGTGQLIRVC